MKAKVKRSGQRCKSLLFLLYFLDHKVHVSVLGLWRRKDYSGSKIASFALPCTLMQIPRFRSKIRMKFFSIMSRKHHCIKNWSFKTLSFWTVLVRMHHCAMCLVNLPFWAICKPDSVICSWPLRGFRWSHLSPWSFWAIS